MQTWRKPKSFLHLSNAGGAAKFLTSLKCKWWRVVYYASHMPPNWPSGEIQGVFYLNQNKTIVKISKTVVRLFKLALGGGLIYLILSFILLMLRVHSPEWLERPFWLFFQLGTYFVNLFTKFCFVGALAYDLLDRVTEYDKEETRPKFDFEKPKKTVSQIY